MVKITQITYERVFNLGNYQSERIGLVASIDEDDKGEAIIDKVFLTLKAKVHELHVET